MKKAARGKPKKSGTASKTRSKSATASKRKKTRSVPVRDPAAPRGRPIVVELAAEATTEDRLEAEHFVRVLDANQQLSRQPGPLPPGATHQVEADTTGTRRLKRKRFSAL